MQRRGNQELLFGHKNLRWALVTQEEICDLHEQLRGNFCAGIKLMGVTKIVFKTPKLDKITSEVNVGGEDSLEALP